MSFLTKELKWDQIPDISGSFEVSEIVKERDVSALLDNFRDISFLVDETNINNKTPTNYDVYGNQLNIPDIGQKPQRISGEQAQLMQRFLQRKRQTNTSNLHRNYITKRSSSKKSESKDPQLAWNSSYSKGQHIPTSIKKSRTPLKPPKSSSSKSIKIEKASPHSSHKSILKVENNQNLSQNGSKLDTIDGIMGKEKLVEEQKKVIEDMIAQGNTIFSVSLFIHWLCRLWRKLEILSWTVYICLQ
jgi:hypothetical protein